MRHLWQTKRGSLKIRLLQRVYPVLVVAERYIVSLKIIVHSFEVNSLTSAPLKFPMPKEGAFY